MRPRTIIYAAKAGDDLDWIYETIAGASSAVTANGYDQRIRAFCESLDYGSERGSRRDDIRPGLRVIGFERRVTIAFTVELHQVVILRVFYGGANWEDEM